MPTIYALQHIFSNVERGYSPRQGRGFQTVAVSAELVGTDDLRILEEASFYALSRERRSKGERPVKETFFRLPSDRFVVGRTVDWGTDSLGRDGNYLTHHLILSREDALAIGANPFVVLDAARLATDDLDLTPRSLPAMTLWVAVAEPDIGVLEELNPELPASLATAIIDGGGKTTLLVGDEARWETILRGLFDVLTMEERLQLTFSTHFYESHHLRPLFAVATVASPGEAPSQQQNYITFDLDGGRLPQLTPRSAYAAWLSDCLRSRRWEEVSAVNELLDRLYSNQEKRAGESVPTNPRACAALWERAETSLARVLVGSPQSVIEFLNHVPLRGALADALLLAASPSVLCGTDASSDTTDACLSALRSAASARAWRSWLRQWKDDPLLTTFLQKKRPWWQRWR
jgi:hypothetical protein